MCRCVCVCVCCVNESAGVSVRACVCVQACVSVCVWVWVSVIVSICVFECVSQLVFLFAVAGVRKYMQHVPEESHRTPSRGLALKTHSRHHAEHSHLESRHRILRLPVYTARATPQMTQTIIQCTTSRC
jgi:hypothetical protein